jgi:hypothetical protein
MTRWPAGGTQDAAAQRITHDHCACCAETAAHTAAPFDPKWASTTLVGTAVRSRLFKKRNYSGWRMNIEAIQPKQKLLAPEGMIGRFYSRGSLERPDREHLSTTSATQCEGRETGRKTSRKTGMVRLA